MVLPCKARLPARIAAALGERDAMAVIARYCTARMRHSV
ncbi:hypothetical protein MYA_4839 [Burkholderia sp. KJ006]|nr:hypothetical protein MYA_4839 [Burkholderia sp. KJ006]